MFNLFVQYDGSVRAMREIKGGKREKKAGKTAAQRGKRKV